MRNVSHNGQIIPVCCKPDELDPADSFCYPNGTFSIWSIFARLFSNNSIAITSRELPCRELPFDLKDYPPNNDSFYLMEDGSIFVQSSIHSGTEQFWIGPDNYCFTSRLTEYGRMAVISVCNQTTFTHIVDFSTVGPQLTLVAVGLSLPFLAATFLVYTFLPELKNVPGFTLRAYVANLFVYFTVYLIVTTHSELHCYYFMALFTHFAIMAHFFWLNVMSFDIWWTLRRVRSVQSESKQENRKRCIIYSIFAWGVSILITGVGAIIDSVPTVPRGIIRTGFHRHCWFVGRVSTLIYDIGPLSLTMICNLCFFVLTAVTLRRHEKDTANCLNASEEQLRNKEKKRFHLYLKLFTIMGITWSADVINWLWYKTLPTTIMVILDIPSDLQGVAIFLIFVHKKKIKKLLLKRLGCKDETVRPVTPITGLELSRSGLVIS